MERISNGSPNVALTLCKRVAFNLNFRVQNAFNKQSPSSLIELIVTHSIEGVALDNSIRPWDSDCASILFSIDINEIVIKHLVVVFTRWVLLISPDYINSSSGYYILEGVIFNEALISIPTD